MVGEAIHHLSPITYHPSRITHHLSSITYYPSRITHHVSPITYHPSRIAHHVSPITYHPSRITLSPITYHPNPNPNPHPNPDPGPESLTLTPARTLTLTLKLHSMDLGGNNLLEDTDLTLVFGRKYGLIGRNGIGKTTFLKFLAAGRFEGMPPQLQVPDLTT